MKFTTIADGVIDTHKIGGHNMFYRCVHRNAFTATLPLHWNNSERFETNTHILLPLDSSR